MPTAGRAPARVAAVCVRGAPPKKPKRNEARRHLLDAVVDALAEADWPQFDALVLPAGYFKLDAVLGPLSARRRARAIVTSELGAACRRAAERLAAGCGGALLAVGVDTRPYLREFAGDQMLFVFDAAGVAGSARKIFPSCADTDGAERPPYLLFEHDAEDESRFMKLAGGGQAVALICYDAFVFSELHLGPTPKRANLRYLGDAKLTWRETTGRDRDLFLERVERLLHVASPDTGLAAVHGFRAPARDTYWQRHGVAAASAALRGGLVVGPAHYRRGLSADTFRGLAAVAVPARHLSAGLRRKALRLAPIRTLRVTTPGTDAIVSLFEV